MRVRSWGLPSNRGGTGSARRPGGWPREAGAVRCHRWSGMTSPTCNGPQTESSQRTNIQILWAETGHVCEPLPLTLYLRLRAYALLDSIGPRYFSYFSLLDSPLVGSLTPVTFACYLDPLERPPDRWPVSRRGRNPRALPAEHRVSCPAAHCGSTPTLLDLVR